MKRLLLILVAACSHASNPPAPENAPPAAVSPRPASAVAAAPALPAAPAPGCYTPPARGGSAVVLGGWSGTFVGSDAPVDCSPGVDAAATYCAHVHDACCVPNGWVCNNARYVDWYAEQCRH